jgi:hypothetical protein
VSRPHRHRYRPAPREVGVGKIVGGVLIPVPLTIDTQLDVEVLCS